MVYSRKPVRSAGQVAACIFGSIRGCFYWRASATGWVAEEHGTMSEQMKKRGLSPGWTAAALFFLLASAPAAGEDGPLPVAFLLPAFSHPPHGEALTELVARALDETDLAFLPAVIPGPAKEHIAALLSATETNGEVSERRSSLLQSEAREYGFDAFLLADAREVPGGIVLSLSGGAAPFERLWTIDAPPAHADSLGAAFGLLAASAAVRFGAGPAVTGLTGPTLLPAEEHYAKAVVFGSLELADRALAFYDRHDPSLSWLGFRLFLRESRGEGRRMLARADREQLGSFLRLVHEGREAYAEGKSDEAKRIAGELERRFPGRYDTALLGGLILLERGDPGEAREKFVEAIRRRPLDTLPHRLLAEAGLRDGLTDLARDEYGRALSLSPCDFLAAIGLASVFYTEGLLTEAEEILSRVPPPDPHGIERGTPFTRHLAARAGLRHAEGRFQEAKVDLVRARNEAHRLGDESGLIDLTVRLFYLFLEEGKLDSARTELNEVRLRLVRDPTVWGRPGAAAYLEGVLGASLQDYGTVTAKRLEVEMIEGADRSWPDLIEGLYELNRGSGWDAILPLRRAARYKPRPYHHYLLGRAALAARKWGSAVRDLEFVAERGEHLLDLPPVLPLSFYYLGRVFEERGDPDQARLAYREFLHYRRYANPTRPEMIHARSYLGY